MSVRAFHYVCATLASVSMQRVFINTQFDLASSKRVVAALCSDLSQLVLLIF